MHFLLILTPTGAEKVVFNLLGWGVSAFSASVSTNSWKPIDYRPRKQMKERP